jgi:hypothetical protein
MSGSDEVWRLFAGDEVVADLVVTGGDFPWLEARFEAQPAFEAFRPLFDAEWAATDSQDWDRADELYREVKKTFRLADADGVEVAEFLLHVQDHEAWWRWSYEPFDD